MIHFFNETTAHILMIH